MSTDTRLIVYLEAKPCHSRKDRARYRYQLVVKGPLWLKQRGIRWGTDSRYSQSELDSSPGS